MTQIDWNKKRALLIDDNHDHYVQVDGRYMAAYDYVSDGGYAFHRHELGDLVLVGFYTNAHLQELFS